MHKHYLLLVLSMLLLFSCAKLERITSHHPSPEINAEKVKIAVIGDYGSGSNNEKAVADMVKSWTPDFIITTGDNNYNLGRASTIKDNIGNFYCDYIYNYDAPQNWQCQGKAFEEKRNRFFPSLGNHDYYSYNGNIPYLNYFTLPGKETYYDFKWGNVHLFAVDSGQKGDADCCDTDQTKWLKEGLQNSTKPFKIVYFHHPPYSSGMHGSNETMQWPFADWGATAVICGHDHHYERITKKSEADLLYFVNGVGGKSLRSCNEGKLDKTDFDSFCYDKNYGAMLIEANAEEIRFGFYTIDNTKMPIDSHIVQSKMLKKEQ